MIPRYERIIGASKVFYIDRTTGKCILEHPLKDFLLGEISEWELFQTCGLDINEEIQINSSVMPISSNDLNQAKSRKERILLQEKELKNDLFFLDFLKQRAPDFNFEHWKSSKS